MYSLRTQCIIVMNIYEYIFRYRAKETRVQKLKERYSELYALATEPRAAINPDGITQHNRDDGRENLLVALSDIKEEYKTAAREYIKTRRRLLVYVSQLKDPNEKSIVYHHVIKNMTDRECITIWEEDHGKELSRTMFSRYLYCGLAHLNEIYKGQDGSE